MFKEKLDWERIKQKAVQGMTSVKKYKKLQFTWIEMFLKFVFTIRSHYRTN